MKKVIITLIVLLILIVGTILGLKFLLFTKENTTKQYLEAYVNENYNEILSMNKLTESDFINSSTLSKNDDNPLVGIESYKIINYKKIDNSTYNVEVSVEYKTKYDYKKDIEYSDKDQVIVLKKSKKNKYLIFDNWYVKTKSTLKDVQFDLPKDTVVYLDGIKVEKKYIQNNDNIDSYSLPELLNKKYEIKLELDGGITQTIKWKPSSINKYYVTLDLDENSKNKILEASKLIIENAHKSMQERKSFADYVKTLNYGSYEQTLIDNELTIQMADTYNFILEQQSNNEHVITNPTPSNYEIKKAYINDEGMLQINLKYHYEHSYLDDPSFIVKTNQNLKMYFIFDEGQYKFVNITGFQFH